MISVFPLVGEPFALFAKEKIDASTQHHIFGGEGDGGRTVSDSSGREDACLVIA